MTEPQPRTVPWTLVLLLILAMVVCYAHRGALSIAAPFMMKDLGLRPATMGVLLSAFFWLYAFMQVPAGWIVDRFGVKWAYAGGFAFWSMASALTGFAQGAMSLIGLRLALGVGQSVAFPASASAVSRSFRDRERGLVTAGYLSGVRIGQAIVGAIGAAMIARYGYRGFFLIISVTALLWLIPWTAAMPKSMAKPFPDSALVRRIESGVGSAGLIVSSPEESVSSRSWAMASSYRKPWR